MPETYVRVKLPGGRDETIYSPSSIIRDYFKPNTELKLVDFETLCNRALDHASQRVLETYGFACSSAMAEKHRITTVINEFRAVDPDQTVHILTINS